LLDNLANGQYKFDFIKDTNPVSYSLDDISKSEFLTQFKSYVAVKSSDKTVDILTGDNLELHCKIDAD
jgi:hypothetical protein